MAEASCRQGPGSQWAVAPEMMMMQKACRQLFSEENLDMLRANPENTIT